VSAPIRGAPLVFADRVFAISIDNKLHAMAAVDGSDLWNFSGLQEVVRLCRRQQPGRLNDVVVAPFSSANCRAARRDRPHGMERIAGRPAPRTRGLSATSPTSAAGR
jgi:hypothetical protein